MKAFVFKLFNGKSSESDFDYQFVVRYMQGHIGQLGQSLAPIFLLFSQYI